jgi:hypothetical protein
MSETAAYTGQRAALADALAQERLRALPRIPYKPNRHEPVNIIKTAFVEFQTKRYSVPSSYVGMTADILICPGRLEFIVNNKMIVTHNHQFGSKQTVEHPTHRERLLAISHHYKLQRNHQLMMNMDQSIALFLHETEPDGQDLRRSHRICSNCLKVLQREHL